MQNFVLAVAVVILSSAFSETLFVHGGGGGGASISEDIDIDESIELLRRVPLQRTQQQQQQSTTTNDNNAMSRILKRHNNNGKNNNNNENNENNDDDKAVLLETHDEHITPGDGFGGGGGGGGDVPSIEELQHEYDLAAEAKEYSNTDLLASELKDNEKEGIVIDDVGGGKVAGIENNNINDNNNSAGKSGKNEEDTSSSSMSMNNIRTDSKQSKVYTRKVSTGVCNKRLELAYNATQNVADPEVQFPQIDTPDDITALCAFRSDADANFGCLGFYYDPKKEPYFFKGVDETTTAIGADDPEIIAVALINLYCDCYYGYDLGCINDLPSTPQEREEYCIFAGVWNGDFDSGGGGGSTGKSGKDAGGGLSQEVLDCGCFWIGQEKEKVGNCPGVDLGYFYDPPDDTLSAFLS